MKNKMKNKKIHHDASYVFPKIIKCRIEGRKVKKFLAHGWVMMAVVRPDLSNVIWMHWIREIGPRMEVSSGRIN